MEDANDGMPQPAERELLHQRKIDWRGFRRKDGLWDLEATLTDLRRYDSVMAEKGMLPAGMPVHSIVLRITVDDELTVRAIVAAMNAVPYHTCAGALGSLSRLEGASLTRGWRRRVEQDLGGEQGCAHIRDLLGHAPTVAFQTIPVWHAQRHGDILQPVDGQPPAHLGTCATWAFDGPVVARFYPMLKDRLRR
ncbi:MAG TPA: DUF2889 domain-containing protein [Ramlibacter sp.]|nr:DUF2889 domain-containing protein [Ramlibacter sp.]